MRETATAPLLAPRRLMGLDQKLGSSSRLQVVLPAAELVSHPGYLFLARTIGDELPVGNAVQV